MASDVARFLWKKFSKSLSEVESHLPAFISRKFHQIGDKFQAHRTSPTTLSISLLYDLNDVVAEWRIFREQRKGVKTFFQRVGLVKWTIDQLSDIARRLEETVNEAESSLSSRMLSQTRSPWDRFTFYERNVSNVMGFDEHEKKMVDWLLASGEGFKSIGIYGMGGSGKTTLVKKVLINPEVRAKFKHNIIWAGISDLTSDNDIDIKIVKYLLNYLGFDTDGLVGNLDEDWLMKQLEHRLLNLENYIIVFDDAWCCNSWFNKFGHKLAALKRDTVDAVNVIVTSRLMDVAEQMVGKKNLIHLNPLGYTNSKFPKDLVIQKTSTEHEKKMVNWLLASGEGLKTIGIYGIGGSGKTALVKKVLRNPEVRAKFEQNIIWACLSELTCDNDIDIKIVKYLLNYLGFDTDGLVGNFDEDWFMNQLKRKLLNLGNYVIVFDDAWHCNSWFKDFCDKLAAFKRNTSAVHVIVTSRIKEVAEQMVGGKNLIHINPLDYKKNSNFLKELVLLNTSMEGDKRLKEIVFLCHGLPVAAKTLPLVQTTPQSHPSNN